MCAVAHPQCEAFTFTVCVGEAQPFVGSSVQLTADAGMLFEFRDR
jgi:hypothetical protein